MSLNVEDVSNSQAANMITISSNSQQVAGRNQSSQLSSRSDRKNKFNVPNDTGLQRQTSNISGNGSSRIQVQSNKNIEKKISIKPENKHLKAQISIKEDVVNEAGSMCKSLSNKTIQLNNLKNTQELQVPQQQNKIKVVYGNQVLQVRQNQSQIVDQMNSSMQSFYSKKSKDLQVYSATDNKMLVLEVKNPENIEKLKLRIEQDEKRKQSADIDNQSMIAGDKKEQENKKQVEINDNQSDSVLSCKICLEEGDSQKQGKIFTPCQCTGTCKWIHEECLKEWIISRYVHLQTSNNPRDFLKAECEICKHKYSMKFETNYKFYKNNIFTRFGKKNFFTCLCSLLCVIAYICCLLFFLVINKSNESNNDKDEDVNNNNNNGNNNGNKGQSSSSNDMSVQSYEYALIIVCTLLIMLSIIVCIISTRQAFFRRSISKWTIFKFDPQLIKQKNEVIIIKEDNRQNPHIQRMSVDHSQSNQEQDRYYYNGQTFTSDLRNNNNSQLNNRYTTSQRRQPIQNRNSMRRDQSTFDQSTNSHVFNLRNSDLMGLQRSQQFMLIQDQNNTNNNNSRNNQNRDQEVNESRDISGLIENQNRLNNTEIIRINNNLNNEEDDYESLNHSQDMAVYQFNNDQERSQQTFNYADNY